MKNLVKKQYGEDSNSHYNEAAVEKEKVYVTPEGREILKNNIVAVAT